MRKFSSLVVASLLALADSLVPAQADPNLQVAGYQLDGTRRISVKVYEYRYKVDVANGGTAAAGASGTLVGVPPALTLVDASVTFGDVGTGATVRSIDTITVRHDRSRGPFTAATLRWQLSFIDPLAARLQGSAGSPALQATRNYIEASIANPALVSTTTTGQKVYRTELLVELSPSATIDQINAGLSAVGGRISAMTAGRTQLTITIPDPGTLTALEAKRAQLDALPGFAVVTTSVLPTVEALPSAVKNSPPNRRSVLHHLAVRAHAVWNLNERLRDSRLSGQRPVLIFDDVFGFGVPDRLYWDYDFLNPADFPFGPCANPSVALHHGYEVASVTAAVFDHNDFNNEDKTVGLFPERLPARAIDNCSVSPGQEFHRLLQIVRELRAQGRNVIVNRSIGLCSGSDVSGNDICTASDVLSGHLEAQEFIDLVRGSASIPSTSLENEFLLFSASGNESPALAYVASGPNQAAAGLLVLPTDLSQDATTLVNWDAAGQPIVGIPRAKLSNILVVDAWGAAPEHPSNLPFSDHYPVIQPSPSCLAKYSNRGGHLSAIGGDTPDVLVVDGTVILAPDSSVQVLVGPSGGDGTEFVQGTSYAAPQAAAVAAWIWALRPTLSVARVKHLELSTLIPAPTTPGSCAARLNGSPALIDAYAAALATDNPFYDDPLQNKSLSHTPDAPARLALLDVASVDGNGRPIDGPDGKFTQADIQKFLQEFAQRNGLGLDYSRYDLNGDGYTGRPYVSASLTGFSRFDYDGNLQWTVAKQTVQGVEVAMTEAAPADISILIHYAYSPLYAGNEYERLLLLAPYLHDFDREPLLLQSFDIDVGPGQNTVNLRDIGAVAPSAAFSSGCPGGARGTPLYNEVPVREALGTLFPTVFFRSPNQLGRVADELPNATNCSSFIATVKTTGRWWINSAGRHRGTGASGAAGDDNEYQMRVYLGDPDYTAGAAGTITPPPGRLRTQTVVWGRVLGKTLDPPGTVGPFQPDARFPKQFRVQNAAFVPRPP